MRVALLCVALAAITTACSDGSSAEPSTTTVPPGAVGGAAPPPDTLEPPPTSDGAAAAGAAPAQAAQAEPPTVVSIELAAPDLGLDADLSAEASVIADPFGDFVACGGTRTEVGTYVVTFARTAGDPLAVSLLSAAPVTGAGIVDADLRIERSAGEPIVAAGTLTLDPDLQSGSFVAFDPDGVRVTGSFECDSPTVPQPLADRTTGSVEVVALLRQGGAERVVSLATSDPALASCPGAVAGQPVVLRADGGPGIGSLTTFELTIDGADDDDAALRMRVGDRVEVFDDVTVVLDDDRSAGTFEGVAGRLSVDGAFTCK